MLVTTYSQNFEDVLLNRLFKDKKNGFYIDVGAADPVVFSVTKWFYELGWRGINIEPIPYFFEKLYKDRPRDINLNIALGNIEGEMDFFESNFLESSSLIEEYSNTSFETSAKQSNRYKVQIKKLKNICEQYCSKEIDFLKIDVEGFERSVLEGMEFSLFRPTVILIEATKPNSGIDPFTIANNMETEKWENILLNNDYTRVYFDGLNCFYLKKEAIHLKAAFSIPVNTYEFILPDNEEYDFKKYKKYLPPFFYKYFSQCENIKI